MTTCGQCGHLVGDGRFCTQCGARIASPETSESNMRSAEPAMAGAGAFGGPAHPPPTAGGHSPRLAETQRGGLAETAVRPMASVPAAPATTPAPTERANAVTERLISETKRWFATADPTWVTVLTMGAVSMLVVFLLGLVLLLH